VRVFHSVFGSYLTSGLFVSNICWVFAAYVFYELGAAGYRPARRASRAEVSLHFPASFLFSSPLSDSLFLLLSLLCVYSVRKNLFRSQAPSDSSRRLRACRAFAVCAGLLRTGRQNHSRKPRALPRKPLEMADGRQRAFASAVPCGLLLYIYVNYRVTGNALMFLTYQSEHWHQQLGCSSPPPHDREQRYDGLCGQHADAMGAVDPQYRVSFCRARHRDCRAEQAPLRRTSRISSPITPSAWGPPGCSPAPRYLTAAYPLALALGAITEKKWADRLATAFASFVPAVPCRIRQSMVCLLAYEKFLEALHHIC
jgi:hypothetical protein